MVTSTYKRDGSLKHSGVDYFEYDSNNRLTKEISDEESKHVIEYTYQNDKLVMLTEYSRGKLFRQNKYKYDDKDNWIEIEFISNSFENIPYTEKIVKRKINYK